MIVLASGLKPAWLKGCASLTQYWSE
jgi:hypothetical protein